LESNRLSDTPQIKPYSRATPPSSGRPLPHPLLEAGEGCPPSFRMQLRCVRPLNLSRRSSGAPGRLPAAAAASDASSRAGTFRALPLLLIASIVFGSFGGTVVGRRGLNRGEVAQRGTQGLLQVPPVTPHRRDKREPFRGGVFFQAAVCETQTRAKRWKAARD